MNDIVELERRILYALERIGTGVAGMSRATATAADALPGPGFADSEALRAELEAERTANAQLTERVRAIKEKQETMVAALEARVARLVSQLDQQGLELQRQRRLNAELTETNRALGAAAQSGLASPELVNAAMAAELEALRAARAAEMSEMEEILSELKPLIGEVA